MAKLIEFDNSSLESIITEVALTKTPVNTGSDVNITLDNNDNFSDSDYVIIGEIGNAQTEVSQINSAVSGATDIQVDTVSFARNTDVKVQKLPYNKVNLYHATSENGTKTLQSTLNIDVNDQYTSFTNDNTSGYFFFSLYNEETTKETQYTHPINVSGIETESRMSIYNLIKGLYKGDVEDDLVYSLIDIAEHEVIGERRWKWTEKIVEFDTIAGQQDYDIETLGITDFGSLFAIEYDGYPLNIISIDTHRRINWGSIASSNPNSVAIWDNTLSFSYTPSEAKTVKMYYYCTSVGFTDTTIVSFPQAIAFRVLQDLWAGEDTTRSRQYEKRYEQLLRVMRKEDIKQTSVFGRLTFGGKQRQYNQLDDVTIDIP